MNPLNENLQFLNNDGVVSGVRAIYLELMGNNPLRLENNF